MHPSAVNVSWITALLISVSTSMSGCAIDQLELGCDGPADCPDGLRCTASICVDVDVGEGEGEGEAQLPVITLNAHGVASDEDEDAVIDDVAGFVGTDRVIVELAAGDAARFVAVPRFDLDGTLRYAPVADASFAIIVTAVASNTVGSARATFEIKVRPSNDAPVVTAFPDLAVDEDAVVVLDVADVAAGPADENPQNITVAVVATNDPGNVIKEAEFVIDDGVLVLSASLVANAHGIVVFDVVVTDDGAPTRATTASITVQVRPINDAPVLLTTRIVTVLGKPKVVVVLAVDVESDPVAFTQVINPPAAFGLFSILTSGAATLTPTTTIASTSTTTVRLTDGQGGITEAVVVLEVLAAQPSCFHVVARDAASGDGVYSLVDGVDAYDAWCDMQHDGGGWTLVLKAAGSDDEWNFSEERWSDNSVLAEDAATHARLVVGANRGLDGESKLRSFSSVKVDELRIGFAAETTAAASFSFAPDMQPAAGAQTAPSLRALIGGSNEMTIFLTPDSDGWLSVDSDFALDDGCLRNGINVEASRNRGPIDRVRIGVVASKDAACANGSSFIGVGSQVKGNVVGNGGAEASSRHAAVFVRSDDLMDLTPRATCEAFADAGFVVDGFYPVLPTDADDAVVRTRCLLSNAALQPLP